MTRGSGRGAARRAQRSAAGRVALQETGAVLGAMLRQALADRLAQVVVAADGPTQQGPQAGDAGDASGRSADVDAEGGLEGRTHVDGEGDPQ